MKKDIILVVAAHPDDEVLGCGGSIAKHIMQGDEVHVLILAEGLTSRYELSNHSKIKKPLNKLRNNAKKANKVLGSSSINLHNFPDNRMDSVDLLDIVKLVEKFVKKFSPVTVYTHHGGDVNIDHQKTHQAVVTATRPKPGQCVKTILFFEVLSSTEWQTPGSSFSFHPNWFVNISNTLETKLKALEAYGQEIRPWPHPRSVKSLENLARLRGSNIGCHAAEAFILGRCINE